MPTRDLLLQALARRDLSVAEATAKLAAQPDGAALVAKAVAARLLDDARLAAGLVEREVAKEPPPSRELLLAKLAARQIPADVASQVVDGLDASDLSRRARDWLKSEVARGVPARKAAGKLARAGHPPEDIAEWCAADEF